MPRKISAGLLMYRYGSSGEIEIFLVHPGGPFFRGKDAGTWGIPKGELKPGETPFDAAIREFTEETGITPRGEFISLDHVRQASGKLVHAWAFEGTWDGVLAGDSLVRMEWPNGSGRFITFPEIDRAGFFSISFAREKINKGQEPFIDRLLMLRSVTQ